VLRAWLEGVERDAFQRAWPRSRPTTGIEVSSLPAALGPLARHVRAQADLRLVVLPGAAGIPVIAAAGVGDNGLVLGMGAAKDPVAAVRKALVEACAELRFPFTDSPSPKADPIRPRRVVPEPGATCPA
jgi:ribosomal protein S12 methylthiotransferase accessory factor YcaO